MKKIAMVNMAAYFTDHSGVDTPKTNPKHEKIISLHIYILVRSIVIV